MEKQKVAPFNVIGIFARTTNENEQALKDIPRLWHQFLSENLIEKIPGKIGNDIYCVYLEYEKDHTKPYSVLLGCQVVDLDSIPSGMIGRSLSGGNYTTYLAKGNLNQGAVVEAWNQIWASDIQRAYTADFEVYGEKALNPENAEVEIFVAMN